MRRFALFCGLSLGTWLAGCATESPTERPAGAGIVKYNVDAARTVAGKQGEYNRDGESAAYDK